MVVPIPANVGKLDVFTSTLTEYPIQARHRSAGDETTSATRLPFATGCNVTGLRVQAMNTYTDGRGVGVLCIRQLTQSEPLRYDIMSRFAKLQGRSWHATCTA